MNKKRLKYWLLILALLAVNGYILLHRNEGYKYYPFKSVSELYVTDSTLYLKDLKFEGDSVRLIFSKNLEISEFETWKIFADSIYIGFAKTSFDTLQIPVKKGVHTYRLIAMFTGQQLRFIIDHSSYNKQFTNELLYSNLPGPQIKISPLKTYQSDKGFSTEEKQNAIQLLKEKTSFNKDSSDFYNTLAITKFVSSLCKNAKGIHAYKLSELRPYSQIQEALKCNADLACGNYSAMIGYLFSVAQIPNRLVTFKGPAGNWQYGVHYYNEIYLREKQQWVLVDAANNLVMPFDPNSYHLFNAVDVKKLVQLQSTARKYCYTFKKDSTLIVPYDSVNSQHIYYNQSNANLCFYHGNADVTISPFRNFIEFYTFNEVSKR